jgi:DNA polymerase (family 10)
MKNREIAKIFNDIADLMEIKDENPFKIRAYRKAALNLEALSQDLDILIRENHLTSIPGVGKDLADKIKEYISSGKINTLEELKKEVPKELLDLIKIPGLGPRKVKLLYKEMGISSVEKLEKFAKEGKLKGLPGMGEKTEENILKGIELVKKGKERIPLGIALPLAESIIEELNKINGVKKISYAGSVRRKRETIGDIDILVTSTSSNKVMDKFISFPIVKEILVKGPTKSSIRTKDDIQIDLRVVEPDSFGAALQYFTGSKNHNIHLRTIAQKKGLKINEYGVFRERTNKKIAGRTEEEVYKVFKMEWIPPEIREDRGEIEVALMGKIPKLIEEKDIKGDLHVHSNWSDGGHPLEEIIEFAHKRGYQYMAITDHSKSLGIARGLDEKRVLKQIKEIEKIEKKYNDFRILKGIEVDIKKDGSLDLDLDILKKLDIVIGAIHTGFKQGKKQLTDRLIKAMETGLVDFISHPTSRLIGERDGYELDWERLLKVAKKTNTGFEINAYYLRLDLDDVNSRMVKEEGLMLEIGTDAHFQDQLDMIKYGVAVARRAWLKKGDVLNTFEYKDLVKYLKNRRRKLRKI